VSPTLKRFVTYSFVGASTFALDLLLLFILTDVAKVNYIAAAGGAFVVAISLNYFLSRTYVFKGSERTVQSGYVNFLGIAFVGLLLVMGGMYVLVSVLGFNYLVSRIGIAGLTGFWNYLINLFVNFDVAGKHEG
jgi:putative flippase GtrA